ncbi:MAG: alpha/beta hydrolase [Methanoregulaceae archaeon]|nr:alpha/beta hydrolase [Methanoregulaceae archaeon]
MRKEIKIALIVATSVLLIALAGFIAWGLTPLGPTDEALAAMESDAVVTVVDQGDFVTFTPTASTPFTGFILYPGGRVDYRSYAPIAREIASRGYRVSIVEMPLSLAVFGIDRADDVIAAYPDIRSWVIGGHSLGGSMAASYAGKNPVEVEGLVFWASYPRSSDDLSSTGLKVLSTYGSNDLVLNRDNLNATLPLLPPGTIMQVIQGGNHAQFGNYGPQPGDGTATISAADQQMQAADLTVRVLRAVEGE